MSKGVIIIVLIIVVIGGFMLFSGDSSTTGPVTEGGGSDTTSESSSGGSYSVGDAADLGNGITLTVNSVDPGYGQKQFARDADDAVVRINVSLMNGSGSAIDLGDINFLSYVSLMGASGNTFTDFVPFTQDSTVRAVYNIDSVAAGATEVGDIFYEFDMSETSDMKLIYSAGFRNKITIDL